MNHYAIIVPARQAKKETLCSLQREEIGKKTVFKMSSGISVLWSLFPIVQLEVGHTEFLFSRLSVLRKSARTVLHIA